MKSNQDIQENIEFNQPVGKKLKLRKKFRTVGQKLC